MCKAPVAAAAANVECETVTMCESDQVEMTPVSNRKKFVVAKVPVVLAEVEVQIDVFCTITLPMPALEIKRIKKRLKLTQCRLISNTNKLFLEGFVRKNIEFATVSSTNSNSVCGDIRHCTVDVPFKCVTEIEDFISKPFPVIPSRTKEFEFFTSTPLPGNFPEKERLLAGDLSEFNEESFEFFNELPTCELISSTITEFDEFLNRATVPNAPFEERTFQEFDEKMVIKLVFKLLQNQQVCIPPSKVCDVDC